MDIIREIVLQAINILTLVFGILGIAFSLMTLFSPKLVQQISRVLNRSVNIDNKLSYLDKEIQIDAFFYSHHLIVGLCLIVGSFFSLIFFFFQLDIVNLARVFGSSSDNILTHEIFINALAWAGKIICLLGLVIGFIILFAPEKMKKIEYKLNSWFETKSVFDKLDASSQNLDTFFFRHPVFFGSVGTVISLVIVVLSIINLLK